MKKDLRYSELHLAAATRRARERAAHYRERHRLRRVREFPVGVAPPRRVRIYSRRDYFILQWWDPQLKRSVNQRVEGDLVSAIVRAREIDEGLLHYRTGGHGDRRLTHAQLIDRFLTDLQRRADAGQVSVATVDRYGAALRHFLQFVKIPANQKKFPFAAGANREFQLALAAHLEQLHVAPNGHAHAGLRPLRSQPFILGAVRAAYQWAADPLRGNILPRGFHNPFAGPDGAPKKPRLDQFGEPDVTVGMATELINICDEFQIRLFAPMLLYGWRASEPTFIFREHIDQEWIRVVCIPELAYFTKGQRDKRFPFIAPLTDLLIPPSAERKAGLLYIRRGLERPSKSVPLLGAPLSSLVADFQRRCGAASDRSAVRRRQIRNEVLSAAGALTYDFIEAEFRKLAKQLAWPKSATLKDLRHLFSTCLENAGMPEYYRRYLMGQSPGRAAIATYTHLNELRRRFNEAVDREFVPILQALESRGRKLRILSE